MNGLYNLMNSSTGVFEHRFHFVSPIAITRFYSKARDHFWSNIQTIPSTVPGFLDECEVSTSGKHLYIYIQINMLPYKPSAFQSWESGYFKRFCIFEAVYSSRQPPVLKVRHKTCSACVRWHHKFLQKWRCKGVQKDTRKRARNLKKVLWKRGHIYKQLIPWGCSGKIMGCS